MNLKDKVVLAHRGFAHRKSHEKYRENSVDACRESSQTDYVEIIELDLRKSKDGVLYCLHGNLLEYSFLLQFPRIFSSLREQYKADSLADILEVISKDKIVFLDIKSTNITRDDLLHVFEGREFKEVILGNKSVSFLDRFTDMPESFTKILNGNIFCNFYDVDKLAEKGFTYFEAVFPFQISNKAAHRVAKSGLMFRISGFGFLTKESYWKAIEKYNITHVSSDFIDI
ncbi:hypothetical protein KTR10_02985 [Candidatus Kaiserbacteria bacterium]|nr:hypothetical protein [Candidatus Kaiserbacteria bacterium]